MTVLKEKAKTGSQLRIYLNKCYWGDTDQFIYFEYSDVYAAVEELKKELRKFPCECTDLEDGSHEKLLTLGTILKVIDDKAGVVK